MTSPHNLVPVFIDKNTGEYYVSALVTAGDGSFGFRYTQDIAASIWYINHGGDTRNFICQVYDDSGNLIIPDSQVIIDENNIEIHFGVAQTGVAHIMFFRTTV